jgi:hypothetical protein
VEYLVIVFYGPGESPGFLFFDRGSHACWLRDFQRQDASVSSDPFHRVWTEVIGSGLFWEKYHPRMRRY